MKNKLTSKEDFTISKMASYTFGIAPAHPLDPEQIINAIRLRPQGESEKLGGRSPVVYTMLRSVGNVVVKSYKRGGLLGVFNRSLHIRFSREGDEVRSAQEFLMLQRVRALGIGAPEPLAWVSEGGFIYKAWLITREIEGAQTLAKLAMEDREKASQYMLALEPIVHALIQQRIFHVDFHAGNVVLDSQGALHVLDFDCAYYFTGTRNRLRDLYLRRWRRAAIKHRLPDELSEMMCSALRKNFIDTDVV